MCGKMYTYRGAYMWRAEDIFNELILFHCYDFKLSVCMAYTFPR